MKIKFITLNFWKGGILFNAAIKFIKQEAPDILVLQEVIDSRDSLARLKKTLVEYRGSAFAPMFFDTTQTRQVEWGNAVFSRLPLQVKKTVFYDIPYGEFKEDQGDQHDYSLVPRNLQQVTVQLASGPINVFNTHGIWGPGKGGDNPRRLAMSRTIIQHVKDKSRVILAGDFNTRSSTRTIKNIEGDLTNVFKDGLKTSFNMKRKTNPGYGQAVVDLIFVSPDIKVVDHYCPQVDVSDHLPLVCILEV
ncbi:endonuclease/exonuclease/phosphatase family protein [Patescibacteria group bacterium]|nr:endonuclease/exonuclease/phosphatase family protein [Patescibacteria group bacterium]MBU1931222.1 endonuclease/exonuclease/phosphatase family protein [Patescibacteria group bacterium]